MFFLLKQSLHFIFCVYIKMTISCILYDIKGTQYQQIHLKKKELDCCICLKKYQVINTHLSVDIVIVKYAF